MTMLPPVFNLLTAAAPVLALVDRRIYRHGNAPRPTTAPYLTWFQVVAAPENTLSETPTIDRSTIQIDIWVDGPDGDKRAERIAEAVRDALEPHAHMTSAPIDRRDPETRLWRMALEFDFWLPRG